MREKSPIESFTERPTRPTHMLMHIAFTVLPWRFFFCPDTQIYLDIYAHQSDRYHTLKIGGIAQWMIGKRGSGRSRMTASIR